MEKSDTPWKFNIEPEDYGLEKMIFLLYWQVPC